MNGGGNPSVGGGGFAASPAGTAPLYYKSAEIASGSAKNLCKKSEDVGGCAPRGTGSPCRCGKLNGGLAPALPARRASAIPGGGLAFFAARLPCLYLLFCPLPPRPPSPVGKGETLGYFMQGASPLASPRLSRKRHLQNLPSRYPAAEIRDCRKNDRKRFPMSSAGSQGEGGPGEMELSVASDGGV